MIVSGVVGFLRNDLWKSYDKCLNDLGELDQIGKNIVGSVAEKLGIRFESDSALLDVLENISLPSSVTDFHFVIYDVGVVGLLLILR